jgi:hypothetical protein|tara:strand:+ start:6799 stop:8040 length:1242 start_codon:yes stop_codon:yes gene_type:complete
VQVILSIVVFLFLFSPRWSGIDLLAGVSICLAVLGVAYSIVKNNLNRVVLYVIGFGAIWSTYFLVLSVLNASYDSTGLEFGLKFIIYVLASHMVVQIHKACYRDWPLRCLQSVAYAGLANALIVCIFFAFPETHNAYVSSIDVSDTQRTWLETGHRFMDVGMGGGASASAVFAMFVPILVVLGSMTRQRKWFLFIPILFLACAVTGRSGVYIATFLLASSLFVESFTRRGAHGVVLRHIGLTISCLFAAIVAYFSFKADLEYVQYNSEYLNWFLEPFTKGLFEADSTKRVVEDMYFLPDSLCQLAFGDANFGRDPRLPYIASDVGWVRLWHAGGVMSLLGLLFLCCCIIHWVSKSPLEYRIVVYSAIATIFIMFFKELHFLPRGGGSLFILLLVLAASLASCERKNDARLRSA